MLRVVRRLLLIAIFGAIVVAALRAFQRRQTTRTASGPGLPGDAGADMGGDGSIDAPFPFAAAPRPPVAAIADADETDEANGDTGDTPFIEPEDGACPESYPVKAKLSSGIFHVPGGRNYERTKADRCYCDADAAERDGLRASKV